jgi:hypothetical protein
MPVFAEYRHSAIYGSSNIVGNPCVLSPGFGIDNGIVVFNEEMADTPARIIDDDETADTPANIGAVDVEEVLVNINGKESDVWLDPLRRSEVIFDAAVQKLPRKAWAEWFSL